MFWTACRLFIILVILTGIVYPFIITEVATLTMPHEAYGSLTTINGEIKGSELIAQHFTSDRYFWPRPSAIDYNPLHSGGSNLGPGSKALKEAVKQRVEKLSKSHPISPAEMPIDLIYTSGSGLDPHISVKATFFQLDRVAKARELSQEKKEKLEKVIYENIEGSHEIFGPRHINVFRLNRKLDQEFSSNGQQ